MNLYIFNQTRRGAVYGIGTYIHELINAMKESDINICVINLISDKPQIQIKETDGIKYWDFPKAISDQHPLDNQKQRELYFHNIVYLLRLHIQDRKDLLFHLNYHQSGRLAKELKKEFDCKIVSVVHYSNWGFFYFDNIPRLRNILNEEQPDKLGTDIKKTFEEEKLFYSNADRIICLSDYMHEILYRDYKLDVAKISVIPNGMLDVVEITADNQLIRAKWNISSMEKIILFAGRIDEVKGVSYLFKAFREVLMKFPNCRLIIAGSGHYDTYFVQIKDICTKITFTGLLDKKELYELYQIADIGVIPSLFEPFGYVAVEMMMNGLPIISTATSGLNEIVDDTCGLKIPILVHFDKVEIDPCLIAEKIIFLLQHPKVAKKMGHNGRKRYLREYSLEVFRKNMLQLYNSLFQ